MFTLYFPLTHIYIAHASAFLSKTLPFMLIEYTFNRQSIVIHSTVQSNKYIITINDDSYSVNHTHSSNSSIHTTYTYTGIYLSSYIWRSWQSSETDLYGIQPLVPIKEKIQVRDHIFHCLCTYFSALSHILFCFVLVVYSVYFLFSHIIVLFVLNAFFASNSFVLRSRTLNFQFSYIVDSDCHYGSVISN